ncbi:unnamed protein product [Penicillium roqueforti FM164]|uniref:Genomic scaffold, ProqFM164S02 n=1 Tax=Penicillium roqueforti (strain FM164) TaxID=1365484 RepID=W6Q999_PENRF|nr:unnamed protein product [Penicillium roqueforti FM164]
MFSWSQSLENNSSPYTQFYRQSSNSSRWLITRKNASGSHELTGSQEWVLWAGPPAAPNLYSKHPTHLENDAECSIF